MHGAEIEQALKLLGDLLSDREQSFEVHAVGGGSLLLLGLIDRPTEDLDLVAVVRGDQMLSAEPLPAELTRAARDVAALLALAENWLNAGPTSLNAAVDQGPRSKHATDLRSLQPTSDELLSAARWALTHDPSEPFRDQLGQALEAFGCVDHGEL